MLPNNHIPLGGVVALSFYLSCLGAFARAGSSKACCENLAQAGLADRIHYPGSLVYDGRQNSYWTASSKLEPWCLVMPESTLEVSMTVKSLYTDDCSFAIRSGGHSIYPESNNIKDGVTIDLGSMNSTVYHANNSTSSIQPGALWRSVYGTLEKEGVAVPGGRSATVGVGGFLTGGGISHHSNRKGLVCDNVHRYELVLGNGDIIQVDKDNHADLFAALKGGSANFGIVTRFDLEAFESSKVWGGVVLYPTTVADPLIDALVSFTRNVDKNDGSTTIIFWTYGIFGHDNLIAASYVNIDGIEMDSPHKDFWAVETNITSTLRTTSMAGIVDEFDVPGGYENTWFTLTFKNDARVIHKAVELHDKLIEEMKEIDPDFQTLNMFQPLGTNIGANGEAKGGNMLGIHRFEEPRVLWLAALHVKDPALVPLAKKKGEAWTKAVDDYATLLGLHDDFVYLNYANKDQHPFRGYGASTMEKMAAVARKYDPEGVFQTRQAGGFKIAKEFDGYNAVGETGRDEL